MTLDLSAQPSIIIATGAGGGQDTSKIKLRVGMVNELTGFDSSGNFVPGVQDLLTKYPQMDLIPTRMDVLAQALPRPTGDVKMNRPFFLKDKESKNLAQLEMFVRREMGRRQQKAQTLNYVVKGHTSDGIHPWTVNTNVQVLDDVFNIHSPMWVYERTFSKSFSSGTVTQMKLILPNTLLIGAD